MTECGLLSVVLLNEVQSIHVGYSRLLCMAPKLFLSKESTLNRYFWYMLDVHDVS